MTVNELIQSGALQTFEGGTITADAVSGGTLVSVNPTTLKVRIAEGVAANLLLLHTKPMQTLAEVELAEGSSLSMGDVYLAGSFADVKVSQCASSECRMVVVQLGDANVTYDVALNGKEAASSLHGVFVGADSEHVVFDLTTRHNVSDCRSESLVKGVVSDRAAGEFRGLVYVAQDAQRTDARQTSRNVEIGNAAHIITKPQLEIYADDVKCSHGATVGQIDDEAILYMRQRGLSEPMARRLLLEGFVGDVVSRCEAGGELCAALAAEVESKLEKL
ncbi:MAG: SufD family Fe-S cluster assembly protein [Alistipes sp.]|nr:SufD family Fe-S cluster assembly protein [Alistipes sp.]